MRALLLAALLLAVPAASVAHGASGCPSTAKAWGLALWPGAGRLHADVDGDGAADTAAIRYAPSAPLRCGFLLTVATRHGVRAAVLPIGRYNENTELRRARQWPSTAAPAVEAIVRAGPGRSAQVVVGMWSGAANLSVVLFGLRAGRLVELPVGRRGDLSLYGSVGTGVTDVWCERGGPLRVRQVWPTDAQGSRWAFSTTTYRLRGTRFVPVAAATSHGSRDGVWKRADPGRPQFGGCALATAARF
jgi:hypothetical protein